MIKLNNVPLFILVHQTGLMMNGCRKSGMIQETIEDSRFVSNKRRYVLRHLRVENVETRVY